ncbi:MAG: multifunctional oxoglutarate decarboxylase/oxoglutarate dehydrogenase thiamine pyrophosphate-binding subunit/dihydrolipoyllysine-residue succinyltransferase subunit [Ignavibacteria bacterium]|nr:multifunctional oxoglutarate decarboxylase/oxoglutarate dehydrogenase thiamine pyrophosphate-binding subunit/dihydrolipoyllysine-residue succinyltransferase subunit [Ignavibacteria bacterium]MCC7159624.1 multifunctional oxoglutarate decarboxylase/oxoglutarate dehydrogenase thiamine pyrophosphate-binding subunit/dihydrolipoyllysine-residue succinyltransferase subunit [Ignavibacteria bacterium]
MKIEDLTHEQRDKLSEFGVNTWFVMELLENYLNNPGSVGEDWQNLFGSLNIITNVKQSSTAGSQSVNPSGNRSIETGAYVKFQDKPKVNLPLPNLLSGEEAVQIKGAGERIIENMTASLSIPTATSFRAIPVKVLEENRITINTHLKKRNAGKISFTHIIGWAIVKALDSIPALNNSFTIIDGNPHIVKKPDVNLGLAVDLEKKDGTRSLIVPNIKKASTMNFRQFFEAYNDIINRSRAGKIEIPDFQGTTITLTNPGTIGTVASQPRLMTGQGAIIATGALDYPAEYMAVTKDIITSLGISKVMNITSTYDHRIIQGAESGMFLQKMHKLLIGEDGFYDEIFNDLAMPVKPVLWKVDYNPEDFGGIDNLEEIEKQAKAIQFINMYRVRGHLLANLDPLKPTPKYHPELDPSTYGFTVWDYDREFITARLAGLRTATLREILNILQKTYAENIGVEYMHIQDPKQKFWLQDKMEPFKNQPSFTDAEKKHILYKLIQAENFEKFVDKKYIGHKRFSLEGSETIIPLLDFLLGLAAKDNVDELVLGMAHRGRLNILANIIGKKMQEIFSEFEDIFDVDSVEGSGDVKYHLGAAGVYETMYGDDINVSVASNPSHLEFVNPVVEGIVRAKQTMMNDITRDKFIPVLIHGDAAIAGEGIVAETLNLSQLRGYSTGGTIHIIINNQIGFTTSPVDARSTVYASDVAKMIQAPIFHVNGDDPEATMLVTKLAYEYRMNFDKDVVIDVYSYRRLGHNEADEPAFTQPVLYKAIRNHDSVKSIYQKKLLEEKVVTSEDIRAMEEEIYNVMDSGYTKAHEREAQFRADSPIRLSKEEVKKLRSHQFEKITMEDLNKVVDVITTLPANFHLHPKLKKFIDSRREFLTGDVKVDWAFAEALAFGTLLLEGIPVRLSGQDSARGTFSQRHIVLADMETEEEIIPHNNIAPGLARIEPLDSLLSEAAVLGFEFGYSTADPLTLDLWEAQFGDFANAAQVIIDNFLTASQDKWQLPSNLVMLLPHGQEGQGPEHSSARLERFLTLCADDNITVCNPSTPAQYYYLLRTQGKYTRRRPLVVMTPKSLLRLPEARSDKSEFIDGTYRLVIDDEEIKNKSEVKRILLTSGKFYYDLAKYRKENNIPGTAIVRIERYYPYPSDEIKETLRKYENAKEVIWAQEEPHNMGALIFMSYRLKRDLRDMGSKMTLYGVSRDESPAPAPGSNSIFNQTQKRLLKEAFAEIGEVIDIK